MLLGETPGVRHRWSVVARTTRGDGCSVFRLQQGLSWSDSRMRRPTSSWWPTSRDVAIRE